MPIKSIFGCVSEEDFVLMHSRNLSEVSKHVYLRRNKSKGNNCKEEQLAQNKLVKEIEQMIQNDLN